MTEDLRVGVIGYGQRGTIARYAHRPGEGSRIVVVADPSARAQQAARAHFGDSVTCVDTVADLLAAGVDAVVILTPDDTHAAITVEALRAGAAVFVEKPMAIQVADADLMLEAAYTSGAKLYVGHNMRHMPVIRQLKRLIDDGAVGRVRAVWCRHFVGHGGDFYFKDWHADRRRTNTLLLQKGAHDLDVIHWLAGGYTRAVQGIGRLAVYGDVTDRRDNSDRLMHDWYSLDSYPPLQQRELNPVVDVEDLSMVLMTLDNEVLASYQQCHFTPDYWRNYTVIGDEGRIENIGDEGGDQIHVWTSRRGGARSPDRIEVIERAAGEHSGADPRLMAEFLDFVRHGHPTEVSAVAAREAVATACGGADSIRSGGAPVAVPPPDPALVTYFESGQVRA